MDPVQELEAFITDENAERVGATIAGIFCKEASLQNVDYDFNISQGKMVSAEVNTSFEFDTPTDSLLAAFKDLLLAPETVTEELQQSVGSFLGKARDHIESTYHKELANAIRKVILGAPPERTFPLDVIRIVNIEIGEPEDTGTVLVVAKEAPAHGEHIPQVSAKLLKEHQETGKSLEVIIAEKKAAGEAGFKYVTGAYTREPHECRLDMFVDYTAVDAPVKNE